MSKPTFPTGNVLPHSLAELVPGGMSDEEFAALCISIKEDGQMNPIMLFEEKILDGRHRYRACVQLKLEPKFDQFKGDKAAAMQYVLANNLHRKTLNSMQKALVGARLCDKVLPKPLTQKDAAERMGVGVATINLAARLLDSKNTPLIKRCERGECTRAEIDEELYDRTFQPPAPTSATVLGDDDDDYEEGADGGAPGSVGSREPRVPNVGTKPKHPERRAASTPANDAAQTFIGLDEVNKRAFVELTWFALEPLVRLKVLDTAAPPAGKETAPSATPAKPKAPAKGKGKKAAAPAATTH